MRYQNFFIYCKLSLNAFEPSYCFGCLILLLAWSHACWNNDEALSMVVFEKSLKLSLKCPRKCPCLRQKQESGGICEFNEIIKRLFSSFTSGDVLLNCVEYNRRPFFGLSWAHWPKLLLNEPIFIQNDVRSKHKFTFCQDSLYSAWMFQRIPIKDLLSYLEFFILDLF